MGLFDGILICSDWDGTLYYKHELNDTDLDAIRYFQENGGKFTICSGRYYLFLKEFESLVKPNANIISLNGAYIAPYEDDKALYEGFLDDKCVEILDLMLGENTKITQIAVNYRKNHETAFYKLCEYAEMRERIRTSEIYSIVLYAKSEEDILNNMKRLNKNLPEGYIAVRSWSSGAELLKEKNQKGHALNRLKKHLGSRVSVAIGDFENDIHMLEAADISYAVGNAPQQVKERAKRVTVPVWECAVSKIIYELENEIKSGLL